MDSRFAEKTETKGHQCLADDYLLGHSTGTKRLKATKKTPPGDKQSGCLSHSVTLAHSHSLHVGKTSAVSLMTVGASQSTHIPELNADVM